MIKLLHYLKFLGKLRVSVIEKEANGDLTRLILFVRLQKPLIQEKLSAGFLVKVLEYLITQLDVPLSFDDEPIPLFIEVRLGLSRSILVI